MNGFFSRRDEAMGQNGGSVQAPVTDDHCPLLSEALQGCWDTEHRCYLGPAYKLSIWLEGSYVKFCLGAGDNFPKFFSSFQGLEAGLEKVEECLRLGKGDWRAAKTQPRR